MPHTKKKIYIIVNPVSGKSKQKKKKLSEYTFPSFDPHKYDIHFMFTGYAGHANEIANQAVADKVDCVVAVGGDGTVNEVARALIGSDTVLGIIPLGSGNGLARDLQIPTDPEKALQMLAEGNVIDMDYGIANDHIFFCTCGVGFDATVAYNVGGKKSRGFLMYMKEMTDIFFKQKPQTYELVYPDGRIKDQMFLVTCANAGQYGYNAYIAPHADVQDGLFDIAVLHPINLLNVPKIGAQMFAKSIDDNKKMTAFRASEITIIREKEGPMHLDGDALKMGKEIHIKIVPKGLKVLVPKNPPKKNPLEPTEIFIKALRAIVRKSTQEEKSNT